jgi:hypothetical protein
MGEQRAAIVFTDPPYNARIEGHASGLGTIPHRPFPMAAGEMNEAEFTAFLGQTCRNLAAFRGGGSLHYVCIDWRHLVKLLAAGREAYCELKDLCVWVEDNEVPPKWSPLSALAYVDGAARLQSGHSTFWRPLHSAVAAKN